MDPTIIAVIAGPLSVAILYVIAAGEPPSVSDDGNRMIASYGRAVRVAIILVSIVSLLITAREYFDRSDDQDVLYFLILMTSVCVPYLLCEGFRTRFEYNNDELQVTTAFRKMRIFPWSELTDISYSHWRSTYLLLMQDGTNLAASEYLAGSDALMKVARRSKARNLKSR